MLLIGERGAFSRPLDPGPSAYTEFEAVTIGHVRCRIGDGI